MMAWETKVNRELEYLNDAHSAARMGTPEYRQRRRALLQAALLAEGAASHTLRRPAGGRALAGGEAPGRALPMRRAVTATAPRALGALPWCLGGGVVIAGLLAWMLLR
ncbi:hypothetical protein C8J98_102204 [Luteibacter sp. OK325]|nr:hypothetical protein C8J98_102204 [Luteibacter sp. OK325]